MGETGIGMPVKGTGEPMPVMGTGLATVKGDEVAREWRLAVCALLA
jgi:hypothetical protein